MDKNNMMGFLKERSEKEGVAFHVILCRQNHKNYTQPEHWPVHMQEVSEDIAKMRVNLVNHKVDNGDFASLMAKEFSECFMFPSSTILMHSLGVMASAMNKAFRISYYDGDMIANLYVVTAQQPSTGKSNINNRLTKPIFEAYKDINDRNKIQRARLKVELQELTNQAASKKTDKSLLVGIDNEIFDLTRQIEDCPVYVPILTDTTIEAAEMVAAEQKGMFNIVSAEAESINVILGAVYSKGGKDAPKGNIGLVLSGWDGEYVSVSRVGRAGFIGEAKGSIAVIAQESSVETIINSKDSRGVSARFLMLNEPDNIGKRVFRGVKKNVCDSITSRYNSIIKNVINEDKVVLQVDGGSLHNINKFRDEVEPFLDTGGKWDNELITQFVGKADKHILKLAAVLHVFNNWHDGGKRSIHVSPFSVSLATQIFKKLIHAYIDTLKVMGVTGFQNEVEKTLQKLIFEKKNKKVNTNQFIDNLRGAHPFIGARNHRKNIKTKVLPYLEDLGYCVVANGSIYINPNL